MSNTQLLEQRNSPYRLQPALETLTQTLAQKPNDAVPFTSLINAIHRNGLQPRAADIKFAYRLKPGKSLPVVKQHLLHAAVVAYNLPLLKQLIEMGVKTTAADHFGRNILHLAHIVDSPEILEFIDSLPENLKRKLATAKDGFGKTPKHIADWKRVIRSVPPNQRGSKHSGWNSTSAAGLDTPRMEIDQVQAKEMSRNRFLSEHLACLKPILIKGALTADHPLSTLCEKKTFLRRFGETKVATGAIPYASTFQQPEQRGALKQVTVDWDQYIFSPLSQTKDKALISAFQCIDITQNLDNFNWQFYQGPAYSGAPIHFHGDAWNLLVHGKKRWFIYRPTTGFYSTQPISDWLNGPYPEALEFTQEAGDLVYIPRYWAHGVINIQESIGIATEFNSPYIV